MEMLGMCLSWAGHSGGEEGKASYGMLCSSKLFSLQLLGSRYPHLNKSLECVFAIQVELRCFSAQFQQLW